MTHLVTGATGLIGGHLARRLVAQGETVRALVRPHSQSAALRELNVELAVGDLCDPDSVRRVMHDVKIVYHCGGLVADWGKRSTFYDANIEGTRHVVQAAVSAGVERLVHLSSAAVYGYRGRVAVDETQPCVSRRIPYIESKIAAEQIVRRAIDEQQLNAVMLRPVMVYGPKCQNYVGEVVRHLRKGSVLLLDGGRHVAGLAYVENVADACLLAGRARKVNGCVFNICDDLPITWKEYIVALADGIGARRPTLSLPTRLAFMLAVCMEATGRMVGLRNRPLLTRLAVLELGRPQSYNISQARRHLGYTPSVGFETAMQKTLNWVRTSL
jgi:nucleoside-diphosphate-sugar epimerase